MSISVELPCGCEITDAHLISICLTHLAEYNEKKRKDNERREKFHREMRDAVEKAMRPTK